MLEQAPADEDENPPTVPVPTVVERKADVISSPAAIPGKVKPATPAMPGKAATHSNTDSDWQRLETIFRKHQEQNEGQVDSPLAPSAAAREQEPFMPAQPPEHKGAVETLRDASIHREEITRENVRAALPPAETIQRQIKQPQVSSPSAVPKVMRKEQMEDTSPVHDEQPGTEITFDRTSHETHQEDDLLDAARDERGFEVSPREQPVPLQYAWDVQRIAEPDAVDDKADMPPASDTMIPPEITDTGKISEPEEPTHLTQPIVFREEGQTEFGAMQPSTLTNSPIPARGQGPVEILAPSRPRPQSKVPSSHAPVQRQPENAPSPDELVESAAQVVDTPIGPLPADLWRLLGQSPPAAATPSEGRVQQLTDLPPTRTLDAPTHPGMPPTPAPGGQEASSTNLATTVQRQTLTTEPSTVSNQDTSTEPAQADETTDAMPDINDLSKRVYAELRQRLLIDWERSRRNF